MSEHEVLRREVAVEILEGGDGRTLVSRLVPYGEEATVSDDGITTYKEMFLPKAFDAQMRAAHRIKVFMNFRHGQSLQDQIGHAASLDDREDGLHGELRVLDHPDGDKALELYRAGMNKLSIEFEPITTRVVSGVVQRVKARLLGVALAPEGAYKGAEVLAVRTPPPFEPELLPPFDPDVAGALARFVYVPPALTVQNTSSEEVAR
jgi:HK97 family phage prohead protease